jgi:hypothetical protein
LHTKDDQVEIHTEKVFGTTQLPFQCDDSAASPSLSSLPVTFERFRKDIASFAAHDHTIAFSRGKTVLFNKNGGNFEWSKLCHMILIRI